MKKKKYTHIILCIIWLFAALHSCKDKEDKAGSKAHVDGEPVVLSEMEPLEGGMASQIIISGSNFGSNPDMIRLWFNHKQASIIGSNGDKLYALVPRQPGDTCTISLAVGTDSTVYAKKFIYHTSVTVTTVVGHKGTKDFKAGTLASATLRNPSTLCVDKENNIFLSHWGTENVVVISQNKNYVAELNKPGRMGVPAPDIHGKTIMSPHDGGDVYYSFDPDAQWAAKKMSMLHPSAEEKAAGKKDFNINYKHSFAINMDDSCIYTAAYNGQIIKFNPRTRKGELVYDTQQQNIDKFLMFHPVQKNLLFMAFKNRHCIYTFDLETQKLELYAGIPRSSGDNFWRDGDRLDAQFSEPTQICFDSDNNLIVADAKNHCIRKITPEGKVTTLIGMGGKSGYVDGNPDYAMFDTPKGVTLDKNGDIYIADYENNCVRKLAVE